MSEIPVCFIIDDSYTLPALVAIRSMFLNSDPETNYKVFVLVPADFTDRSRQAFLELDPEIKLIDLPENNVYRSVSKGKRHVSTTALYKFDLAELFSQYEKLLYLDADILVLKDLSELFLTDIEDYYLAAVESFSVKFFFPECLEQLQLEHHFNSGIMLLNLKRMRDDHIREKLIDHKLHGWNLFMDQDALNAVLGKNAGCRFLPVYYNLMFTSLYRFSAGELCRLYGIPEEKTFTDLCLKSSILHFNSAEKPWIYNNTWKNELWLYYYKWLPLTLQKQFALNQCPKPKPKLIDDRELSPEFFEMLTKKHALKTVAKCTDPGDYSFEGPLMSIIVPVLNTARYLSQCLESILSQSYPFFEVLCIDGGSSDDSVRILENYKEKDGRIRLELAKSDSAGAARNKGLELAKGKYAVFIDSDDYVDKDFLKCLAENIRENAADIICFPCYLYDDPNTRLKPGEYFLNKSIVSKYKTFSRKDIPDNLYRFSSQQVISRVYNLDFIRKNGLHFQNFPCFDELFFTFVSLYKAECISWVKQPLYYHRNRVSSKNIFRWKHAAFLFKALESSYETLSADSCPPEIINGLCSSAVDMIYNIILSLDHPKTRETVFESLAEDKFYFLLSFIRNTEKLSGASKNQAEMLRGGYDAWLLRKNDPDTEITSVIAAETGSIPLVSVIMPVFQSEKYLAESLASVLEQSFQKFELICIDDGSTDRSLQILSDTAKSDPRIRVFRQEHAGVSTARNNGIRNARGKYIYFMDSDDLLNPEALEVLYKEAESRDTDALFFDAEAFYDENCTEAETWFRPRYGRSFQYPAVIGGEDLFVQFIQNREFVVTVWMAFYKRSLIVDKNLQFYPGIIHSDNLFYYQAIISAEKAGYLNKKLYSRRIRPNSIMTAPVGFLSPYSYFVVGCEMLRFLYMYSDTLKEQTRVCSSLRIKSMIDASRSEFRTLSDYEKGKLFLLKEDFSLFRSLIADPSNHLQQKLALERKNKELQTMQKELTNKYEKSLAEQKVIYQASLKKKENQYNREIKSKDRKIADMQTELDGLYKSASWKVGNLLIRPAHFIKTIMKKLTK